MLCLIADDDLQHIEETSRNGRRGPLLTACGRPVLNRTPDDTPVAGSGCPICLPGSAHPLAEIWMICERLDHNANAGAAHGKPRFLQEMPQ